VFEAWKLCRAVKRYAKLLPHQLFANYGTHEFYHEPQIRNAIADAGLDPHYAVLGYARYLSRDHFGRLQVKLPFMLTYDEARALFVVDEFIDLQSRTGTPGPMRTD
jgi:hypothetical protein